MTDAKVKYMKFILTAAVIVAAFNYSCPAGRMTCPEMRVEPPESALTTEGRASFSVPLSEAFKSPELRYEWKVSAGRITMGRDKHAISVDPSGLRPGTE